MKVNLIFENKEFDLKQPLCFGHETLRDDLELQRILLKMSGTDTQLLKVCTQILFTPLNSLKEIEFRQKNLQDALAQPEFVRRCYALADEVVKQQETSWYFLNSQLTFSVLSSSIELLKIFSRKLLELRCEVDKVAANFQSQGFMNLANQLQKELTDEHFKEMCDCLAFFDEKGEILIGASLGDFLQGVDYHLLKKEHTHFKWGKHSFSYSLAARDDIGAADLGVRQERAITEITNMLAQAAEHLLGFFRQLRNELAFYVGCLNLADSLKMCGMNYCMPVLLPSESQERCIKGIYDCSLALLREKSVISNDLATNEKRLTIITGANQGGKSTFLRSIGQAQLMAQTGLFVAAEAFLAPLRSGIFSHFKKEEDKTLVSGKLDEELARMDKLVDHLLPHALMLFNESFVATNEQESSEICRQITRALIESQIEVFSVTHLYDFAMEFKDCKQVQYLRAQRLSTGARTYKIMPGFPLRTAYGLDLYERIFADEKMSDNADRREKFNNDESS